METSMKMQMDQSQTELKRSEESWKREIMRVETEKNQLTNRVQQMEIETKEKQETLAKEREYREAKQQLLAGRFYLHSDLVRLFDYDIPAIDDDWNINPFPSHSQETHSQELTHQFNPNTTHPFNTNTPSPYQHNTPSQGNLKNY